jgi:hypothetical protein
MMIEKLVGFSKIEEDSDRMQIPIFYYVGLVSYILFYMQSMIAWEFYALPFKFLAIFCLLIHVLLVFRLYSPTFLLGIFISFIIIVFVGYNSEQLMLLVTSFALIIGAKGIDFRDILKIHFYVALSIFLISVIGSSVGIIENRVITLDFSLDLLADSKERYCYGYVWPTDCANHISFVCLSYWVLRNGLLKYWEVLLFILAIVFVLYYPQARQSSAIILIMLLFTMYLSYLKRKQKQPSFRFQKLLVYIVPFFSFVALYTTICYEETDLFWIALDLLLSTRLFLGHQAIEQYGIKWFGQYVIMEGGDINYSDYNYVDSSYVQAFIVWGIVLVLLLIVSYVIISWKALVYKEYALLIGISIAGLAGLTSQFMFQIMCCPFLLALFSNHSNIINNSEIFKEYDEEGYFEEADHRTHP